MDDVNTRIEDIKSSDQGNGSWFATIEVSVSVKDSQSDSHDGVQSNDEEHNDIEPDLEPNAHKGESKTIKANGSSSDQSMASSIARANANAKFLKEMGLKNAKTSSKIINTDTYRDSGSGEYRVEMEIEFTIQ